MFNEKRWVRGASIIYRRIEIFCNALFFWRVRLSSLQNRERTPQFSYLGIENRRDYRQHENPSEEQRSGRECTTTVRYTCIKSTIMQLG